MIAAVTGASGHIGANLVRLLLDKGFDVRVPIRKDTRAVEGLNVQVIQGDITDLEALKRLTKDADYVFHAAAVVSLQWNDPSGEVMRVNVDGSKAIVEACKAQNCGRLIHFGSIHAFEVDPQGVDEDSPLALGDENPVYDRSKALSVAIVRRAVTEGLDAVIVCPTAVIGPYDFKPSALGKTIIQLAKGKMPVAVAGGYDFVDSRDVADGAILAAKKGKRGHTYILNGTKHSIKDLAIRVASITGVRPPLLYLPIFIAYAGLPFANLYSKLSGKEVPFTSVALRAIKESTTVITTKASAELGYQVRPFEKTVEDTVKWFKVQGVI